MATDPIFQPLKFRNLTVKNRIFRSSISGRFDNYDGSGNPGTNQLGGEVRPRRRRGDHFLLRARSTSAAGSCPTTR